MAKNISTGNRKIRSKKRTNKRKWKFGARARAFVRKTKAVVKKVISQKAELKWAEELTSTLSYNSAGTLQVYTTPIYCSVSQGSNRNDRVGNEIQVKGNKIELTITCSKLLMTDEFTFFRAFVYKPRLLGDSAVSDTDMDAIWLGTGVGNLWRTPPFDSTAIAYDSGVQKIDSNKAYWQMSFKEKNFRLKYMSDSDTTPANRSYQVYIAIYHQASNPVSVFAGKYMSYKDL